MKNQLIRRAEACNAQIISEIYNWRILNSTITFETERIDQLGMRRPIVQKLGTHDWLAAEVSGRIVGYAYMASFDLGPLMPTL